MAVEGSQARGNKSHRRSWVNTSASTLSVFIFASAIALVLRGFETATSVTNGFRMATTSQVLTVTSSATLSIAWR